MGLLVAGTKYRGEFEERLKKLMEEIKQNDDIILVSLADRFITCTALCPYSAVAVLCFACRSSVDLLTLSGRFALLI